MIVCTCNTHNHSVAFQFEEAEDRTMPWRGTGDRGAVRKSHRWGVVVEGIRRAETAELSTITQLAELGL